MDLGAAIAALDGLLGRHAAAAKRHADAVARMPSARSALDEAERWERAVDAAAYPAAVITTREARAAVETIAVETQEAARATAAVAAEIVEAWRPLAAEITPGLRSAEAAAASALRSAAMDLLRAGRDLNAVRYALGDRLYLLPRLPDPDTPDRAAADKDDLKTAPAAVPHLDDFERLRAEVDGVREAARTHRAHARGAAS